MCGRYTITGDLAELEKLVRFICKVVDFKPRYNLAPRAIAPVLIWEGGTVTLKPMRWGLIPSWSKDEAIGDKLTNARADTITEKPSYRRPFEKQRCLIPADGFYEWQTTPAGKQPFRFTRKDGGFFCMAGIWEKWIRPHREGELGLDDIHLVIFGVQGSWDGLLCFNALRATCNLSIICAGVSFLFEVDMVAYWSVFALAACGGNTLNHFSASALVASPL